MKLENKKVIIIGGASGMGKGSVFKGIPFFLEKMAKTQL